jgi:rhodanese-related sulfurtransferase
MTTGFYILLAVAIGFALFSRLGVLGVPQIDARSAHDGIMKSGMVVIDVRTPGEFGSGCIEGAVNIPAPEIRERLHELSAFREKPVVVYCLRGSRSVGAVRTLRRNGFTGARSLRGGIHAWIGGGFPAVKDP